MSAESTFEKSVFINCPYDESYIALFRPLIFTVRWLGLTPRVALERADSGEARLEKIKHIIRESRWGIHDLSRCRATLQGEAYRMNMPLELGLDLGARCYGGPRLRTKRHLILEENPRDCHKAISDISGNDAKAHKNDPEKLVAEVRHWLVNEADVKGESPTQIWYRFHEFMAENQQVLSAQGYTPRDIQNLPENELSKSMAKWIEKQKN